MATIVDRIFCHHAALNVIAEKVPNQSSSSPYSDPAFWVSVGALIVSISLPLLLDGRQAPRVRAYISELTVIVTANDIQSFYEVSAINHGRSSVLINEVGLFYWDKEHKSDVYLGLARQAFTRGPERPYKVEPYSNVSFGVPQNYVNARLSDTEKVRLRGSLALSNGYRIKSRRSLLVGSKRHVRRRYPWLRLLGRLRVKEKIQA